MFQCGENMKNLCEKFALGELNFLEKLPQITQSNHFC